VSSTATKSVKLEIRCLPEEKQRFHALALSRGPGFDTSKLVRERFPEVFGSALRRHRRAPNATAGDNGVLDLVEWLAERTGRPRAVMRSAISSGDVRVGGQVYVSFDVKREKLRLGVELDGVEVPQRR
jgi:hypothetical protein